MRGLVSFARARAGAVLATALAGVVFALPPASPAAELEAGAGLTSLIEDLGDRRVEVWQNAERRLAKAGPRAVGELLGVKSPRMRVRVQRVLQAMGPKQAIPALISALETPALRGRAAGHLFTLIGPESAGEAERLLSCMQRFPDAAVYCGQALVKAMGPKAGAQVEALVAALREGDSSVKVYAAAALGQIGPKAGKAVPALAAALLDSDPALRWSAALSLGRLRKKVTAAREALEAVLSGPESETRREVEAAMRDVDG